MNPVAALAVLGLGALLLAQLPPERRRMARAVAVAAQLLAIAVMAPMVVSVADGTTSVHYLGTIVANLTMIVRLDAAGAVVLAAAAAAALLTLARTTSVRSRGALLLAIAATVVACCGGTVTLLATGAGMAVVAQLWESASEARRVGRGAVLATTLGLIAVAGVTAAALQLLVGLGTDDPTALPAGALGTAIELPWALGAVALLVGAGIGGEGGGRRHDVAAVALVPTGVILLVRLAQAGGGVLDPATSVVLGIVGTAIAIVAALRAGACATDIRRCGAWLCVASGGITGALAGVPGNAGRIGFAAAAIQLGLVAAAAPLWSRPMPSSRPGQLAGRLSLIQLGCLPLGFGSTAALLGVDGALALGTPAGRLLALALVAATVLMAIAGVRGAIAALPATTTTRWRGEGLPAVLSGIAVALVPGFVMSSAGGALAGTTVAVPDWLTVLTTNGGWAGGDVTVALLLAAITAVAATALLDLSPALVLAPARPARSPRPLWSWLIRPARRLRPWQRTSGRTLRSIDSWLVLQPQLGIAVLAAVIAVIVVR